MGSRSRLAAGLWVPLWEGLGGFTPRVLVNPGSGSSRAGDGAELGARPWGPPRLNPDKVGDGREKGRDASPREP